MADSDDRLLSVADVAKLLSVTEPTVREWIKEGKLKAHRAGARFWRIRKSEVDRMLGEQADTNPGPPPGGRRAGPTEPARDLLSSLITNPERTSNGG
jgi:excisionase family DNA binding protein